MAVIRFVGVDRPLRGKICCSPCQTVRYQVPFRFTGKLNKLTLAIDPPKLTAEDERRLEEAARRAADGPGATAQR